MKDLDHIDFHCGWLIEIVPFEQVFKAVCYSPSRQCLVTPGEYLCNADAFRAAKQHIDYQAACNLLTATLRDFYEAGHLEFDEWRALQSCLV